MPSRHAATLSRTFSGLATRAVAMPLGGIGTGSIALAGDGSLRQWQIHNQANHQACVPHSFFAVSVGMASGERVSRVLQSAQHFATAEPAPPPTSSDHIVPIPHQRLLGKLPGVESTTFAGEYPLAQVAYHDAALPINMTLDAFNPFVPLDTAASAIPVIAFTFTLHNSTTDKLEVSLLATLQNTVGWDGVAAIFNTSCNLYGGNVNTLIDANFARSIVMSSATLPDDAAGNGTMALSVNRPDAHHCSQWTDLSALWNAFSTDGSLPRSIDAEASPPGRTVNGALLAPISLAPDATEQVTFLLAWHFPNRYVNYPQEFLGLRDEKSHFWLGNHYASRFTDAHDVIDHVWANYESLRERTELAHRAFHDTTLPHSIIDTVTSQMSIIRTPTCFHANDGNLYGFEGCSGFSTAHHTKGYEGCCPLNCTHVWNYEMSLAALFPELERTMRHTEWTLQQHPSGYLPHRVTLPAYMPRMWDRSIGGPDNPALDGLLGAILKTYREFRVSGDCQWLRAYWPHMLTGLSYIERNHDPSHTGTIEGEQPNTYDISIFGLNTFIGTLYLASLRAMAAMGEAIGDTAQVGEWRARAKRGAGILNERLFNGEYFVQDVDLHQHAEQNWATGCHADHLLGQWWAYALDLGDLLPGDHLRLAITSIFDHNYRANLSGSPQPERTFVSGDDGGLLLCTWPHGGRPEVPTRYSDETWTGIEYEVAALLLWSEQTDRALTLLDTVRARYDGTKQNPFNDIECGDHYVRAMSSWTLLTAATMFAYSAADQQLTFGNAFGSPTLRAPFVAGDAWGQIGHDEEGRCWIEVAEGTLTLRSLRIQSSVSSFTARIDGQPISIVAMRENDGMVVRFSDAVTLVSGTILTLLGGDES